MAKGKRQGIGRYMAHEIANDIRITPTVLIDKMLQLGNIVVGNTSSHIISFNGLRMVPSSYRDVSNEYFFNAQDVPQDNEEKNSIKTIVNLYFNKRAGDFTLKIVAGQVTTLVEVLYQRAQYFHSSQDHSEPEVRMITMSIEDSSKEKTNKASVTYKKECSDKVISFEDSEDGKTSRFSWSLNALSKDFAASTLETDGEITRVTSAVSSSDINNSKTAIAFSTPDGLEEMASDYDSVYEYACALAKDDRVKALRERVFARLDSVLSGSEIFIDTFFSMDNKVVFNNEIDVPLDYGEYRSNGILETCTLSPSGFVNDTKALAEQK